MAISNIQLFTTPSLRGGTMVANGHQFNLTIEMSFCNGASGSSDCTLVWGEKTNIPYYGLYPSSTSFTDMYALVPNSVTFSPWNTRTIPCPKGGPLKVVIVDIPSLGNPTGVTQTRTLDFQITVRSGSGCTCGYTSYTVTARQVLQMFKGNLVTTGSSLVPGATSHTP